MAAGDRGNPRPRRDRPRATQEGWWSRTRPRACRGRARASGRRAAPAVPPLLLRADPKTLPGFGRLPRPPASLGLLVVSPERYVCVGPPRRIASSLGLGPRAGFWDRLLACREGLRCDRSRAGGPGSGIPVMGSLLFAPGRELTLRSQDDRVLPAFRWQGLVLRPGRGNPWEGRPRGRFPPSDGGNGRSQEWSFAGSSLDRPLSCASR